MLLQFPDGQIVRLGTPFTYDGVNYPASWLVNMTPAERTAWGLVELPEPPPVVTPNNPVPQTVSPRQARRALIAAGMLDAVNAAVEAASPEVRVDWEYANEIRRDNPVIAAMAVQLNLTEQQIDDLFIAAAQVV